MVASEAKPLLKASSSVLVPASAVNNKPLAPNPAHGPAPILTQKQWVIPPRPKPGRKPALDAPPTKRKAQNREAQRAFRQRRAAKVGELEDQMKQMEEEDSQEQSALREHITGLELQVNEYARLLEEWKERCESMEREWTRERQTRQSVEMELQLVKQGLSASTDVVQLPPRKPAQKVQESSLPRPSPQEDSEIDLTCGRCSLDTRCQCIEEAFEMSNVPPEPSNNAKRPLSPHSSEDNGKRLRQDDDPSNEPSEIDFTTPRPPMLSNATSHSDNPVATAGPDPCGFCQDGTPCICAEIYRQDQQQRRQQQQQQQQQQQRALSQQLTPPAEAPPDSLRFSIASKPATKSACTSNPGTCTQCQTDPRSTLFCKSLAATRTSNQVPMNGPLYPGPATTAATGPTLSCADAFSTLARHPAFPQASVELNTWVPQLATRTIPSTYLPPPSSSSSSAFLSRDSRTAEKRAVPTGALAGSSSSSAVTAAQQPVGLAEGRTAFEIEAASVMGVLRFFDRRFGADGRGNGDGEVRGSGSGLREVEKDGF